MLKRKFNDLRRKFLVAVMCLAVTVLTFLTLPLRVSAQKPCFDFTGTGRTSFATTAGNATGPDISWSILSNGGDNSAQLYNFGRGSLEGFLRDGLAPGYYDGDNKADAAVYRLNGSNFDLIDFYVRPSTQVVGNSSAYYGIRFGASPDLPRIGDYDGDGRDDLTVVRNNSGTLVWFILYSGTNTVAGISFGLSSSDTPVNGADYNGDGRDEITVIRLEANRTSTYYAGDSRTGAIVQAQNWGNNTDVYVIGDYLGDRRADFAVRRKNDSSGAPAQNSTWYILENGGSGQIVSRVFGYGNAYSGGAFADYALCGDYNGDGKQDIAVYRYSDRVFYWLNSPDFNSFSSRFWGQPNALNYPVANLHTFNDR